MTTHEQIRAEEREALRRVRAAQRAARARSSIHAAEVWAQVRRHPGFTHCRCGLHRGMTRDELRALGCGCAPGGRWICPVLDKYRRLLG